MDRLGTPNFFLFWQKMPNKCGCATLGAYAPFLQHCYKVSTIIFIYPEFYSLSILILIFIMISIPSWKWGVLQVDLLSRLHSPYLLQLLGYCADQQHRLLIFEFMPNGTLQQHLHSPRDKYQPLDWGTRLRIAVDCARALEFLHDHSIPTVIHRDFKCTNILLDQNFRAKVSDFGLAKIGSEKINGQILTRVLGTTGYLAPE